MAANSSTSDNANEISLLLVELIVPNVDSEGEDVEGIQGFDGDYFGFDAADIMISSSSKSYYNSI